MMRLVSLLAAGVMVLSAQAHAAGANKKADKPKKDKKEHVCMGADGKEVMHDGEQIKDEKACKTAEGTWTPKK